MGQVTGNWPRGGVLLCIGGTWERRCRSAKPFCAVSKSYAEPKHSPISKLNHAESDDPVNQTLTLSGSAENLGRREGTWTHRGRRTLSPDAGAEKGPLSKYFALLGMPRKELTNAARALVLTTGAETAARCPSPARHGFLPEPSESGIMNVCDKFSSIAGKMAFGSPSAPACPAASPKAKRRMPRWPT